LTALLDVNVLIALAWPNHIHHDKALLWFEEHQSRGWATCPLTESGFVRVSSNKRLLPEARTPVEAIELLRRMTGLEHHEFWTDDVSIARSSLVDGERIVGHNQVTDAHLVALAIQREGRLATFDRGVAQAVPRSASPEDVLLFLA
jgi:toxin-antitoxin system PIN domain toxin